MNHTSFIEKFQNMTSVKSSNISIFLLGFILNKESRVIQIGSINAKAEEFIEKTVGKEYYVKKPSNNFNFNQLQRKKNFVFQTFIIGVIDKTYEFCQTYSDVYRQMDYVFIHYDGKRKLCEAIRTPFSKKKYHKFLEVPFEIKIDNKGHVSKKEVIQYEILTKGDIRGETGDAPFYQGFNQMNRTSIINHLIQKYKLENYLEIGIRDGSNFNKIDAALKIGVDPEPSSECKGDKIMLMTSDEYFSTIQNTDTKFDIVFIDGLHLEEQVTLDISNSLKHLKEGGFVVMHDCNPPTKKHQRENYLLNGKYLEWNGTTWKSYVKLRMKNPSLSMSVVNTDWGVGIIQKGSQKCYPPLQELTYGDLQRNREYMLNLISVYEFLQRF